VSNGGQRVASLCCVEPALSCGTRLMTTTSVIT